MDKAQNEQKKANQSNPCLVDYKARSTSNFYNFPFRIQVISEQGIRVLGCKVTDLNLLTYKLLINDWVCGFFFSKKIKKILG